MVDGCKQGGYGGGNGSADGEPAVEERHAAQKADHDVAGQRDMFQPAIIGDEAAARGGRGHDTFRWQK